MIFFSFSPPCLYFYVCVTTMKGLLNCITPGALLTSYSANCIVGVAIHPGAYILNGGPWNCALGQPCSGHRLPVPTTPPLSCARVIQTFGNSSQDLRVAWQLMWTWGAVLKVGTQVQTPALTACLWLWFYWMGPGISSSHLKHILQNNILFSFAPTFFWEALIWS